MHFNAANDHTTQQCCCTSSDWDDISILAMIWFPAGLPVRCWSWSVEIITNTYILFISDNVQCPYHMSRQRETDGNNNNNNKDDIYSAVMMSSWPQVIARVHFIHLMNVEQRQRAADPQTKPPDLRCESACRLLSSTTTIAIYYYYSARKLILIYRPTEGRMLSWPTTTAHSVIRSQDVAHCSQTCYRSTIATGWWQRW